MAKTDKKQAEKAPKTVENEAKSADSKGDGLSYEQRLQKAYDAQKRVYKRLGDSARKPLKPILKKMRFTLDVVIAQREIAEGKLEWPVK